MLVLGLADNHDSGAAVSVDGALVAAIGQERLDRTKNSGAFPWQAIDRVLAQVGARPADVDLVVVGSAFTPSTILRVLPGWHKERRSDGVFSYLVNLYVGWQVGLRQTGLHALEIEASRGLFRRWFEARGFRPVEIRFMDHHQAHAEAAYRTQGETECLVLTLDAMGDGVSATAWIGRNGHLDVQWIQSGLAAVNLFYSRVTELLGFRANRHEGKITGLAAFTEPPPELVRHLEGLLSFRGGRFSRMNVAARQHPKDPFWSFLSRYDRAQVASAAQVVLEKAVLAWVRFHVERTGIRRVAVAGGIFSNVKLNQRIAELPEVESLWVYPNMGDGGLPAGAVLGAVGATPTPLPHAYLGPAYDDATIEAAIRAAGIAPVRPADLHGRVAELIADGRVVARFDGAMEWGPRALGNRSILYRPDDPSVNDWLNVRLKRSEFMPFAPITLAEHADDAYVGLSKAADAARFMTICFQCTPWMQQHCAGVVHRDGTARPQVVHKEHSPGLHDLMTRFKERTGLPTMVNTSFNIHEEPIVCSPEDALRSWAEANLDALILGPFLLERAGPRA